MVAFAALVAATVAAFFVTQHLKVTTPLIAGTPAPDPAAINPLGAPTCGGISYRSTTISFYLLHRADVVDVFVINQSGTVIRTVAAGRHMRRGVRKPDGVFYWNGRQDNGRVAPDGTYYFRVALLQQGRTIDLTNTPVTVKTAPPRPVVTGVSPQLIPQRSTRGSQQGTASRESSQVTIRYAGNENRGATVQIYRTDLPGTPRLVKSFLTPWKGQTAVWDGKIRRRPAAAGTYLVGLEVTDAACNTGRFPHSNPPAPGSTPHAGVTVRYLAAQPPLTPVPAGSSALVAVQSSRGVYSWSLLAPGARKPLAAGVSARPSLRVPLPAGHPGLYQLALSSGPYRTAVPLIAASPRPARVLVVLPALTWQGLNPVDGDGDGLPDTLAAGGPIALARPLANGLPAGVNDEGALLAYLDSTHRSYELTTDLALLEGTGPKLEGHAAVILAGSELWLPSSLSAELHSYAVAGGNVLSLGVGSLQRGVTVQGASALDPTAPKAIDALGARPGALVADNRDQITVISDDLGIFSGASGAFTGVGVYQPFASVAASGQILSEAGTGLTGPAIVGFRLGRGTVVEVGVPGLASRLAGEAAARQFVNQVWSVLSR